MKIGLVGVGHLGKIHLKCLLNTPFEFIGIYDIDKSKASEISEEFNVISYNTLDELLNEIDCLDIVTPTGSHFEIAKIAISSGKHVFIEKPITENIDQAEILIGLAEKHQVIAQVGHVERYNPAILALKDIKFNPKFIEGHRLAVFNPRGTDVSVILDLMIHDIDIVLSMVDAEVKSIHANGVCVVSDTPDICNARIEFENGCVANLTASRISMKSMRKLRLFQEDAYISLDLLQKETQVIRIEENIEDDDFSGMTIHTNHGLKRILIDAPSVLHNNAIEDELTDFYLSVSKNKRVTVSLNDGMRALKLALEIQNIIEQH